VKTRWLHGNAYDMPVLLAASPPTACGCARVGSALQNASHSCHSEPVYSEPLYSEPKCMHTMDELPSLQRIMMRTRMATGDTTPGQGRMTRAAGGRSCWAPRSCGATRWRTLASSPSRRASTARSSRRAPADHPLSICPTFVACSATGLSLWPPTCPELSTCFVLPPQEGRFPEIGRAQVGRVKDMVFSPAQLVEHVSRFMSLFPGDVILTGRAPCLEAPPPPHRSPYRSPCVCYFRGIPITFITLPSV